MTRASTLNPFGFGKLASFRALRAKSANNWLRSALFAPRAPIGFVPPFLRQYCQLGSFHRFRSITVVLARKLGSFRTNTGGHNRRELPAHAESCDNLTDLMGNLIQDRVW